MRLSVGLRALVLVVLAGACSGANQAASPTRPTLPTTTTVSSAATIVPVTSSTTVSTTAPPTDTVTVPSVTTIVTVPQPYHPLYDTFAELWQDSYEVERWSFGLLSGGYYSLDAVLVGGPVNRGKGAISAADLALYHMSPTGQYIVFEGRDEINHLYCLLGGYSRIFRVDPKTDYVLPVLPIWLGGTYLQFEQTQEAGPPVTTFTTTPTGLAVYREAPVCAGNPTAQPG